MSDLIKKADGFRLSVYPSLDDISAANGLINRLTAKLAEVEASADYWHEESRLQYHRAEAAEARERDTYQRGYKAALENAAKEAEDKAYWSPEEIAAFSDGMKEAERRQIREDRKFHRLAEAIRAIPLPDK